MVSKGRISTAFSMHICLYSLTRGAMLLEFELAPPPEEEEADADADDEDRDDTWRVPKAADGRPSCTRVGRR